MEVVTVFSCAECGFSNATMDNAALIELIEDVGPVWVPPFSAERPAPEVWSPLEYAFHYRDAIEWYAERIDLVLTADRPQLEGRDFSVTPEPSDAIRDVIAAATQRVTQLFRSLSDDEWARVGIGSSDGGERSVRNLASRLAHEGVHHLLDIGRSVPTAQS
jgi:hypothetical protein